MIIVITYFDKKLNRQLVSHGVDADTLETIILPPETPQDCGAKWDPIMQEWIIRS